MFREVSNFDYSDIGVLYLTMTVASIVMNELVEWVEKNLPTAKVIKSTITGSIEIIIHAGLRYHVSVWPDSVIIWNTTYKITCELSSPDCFDRIQAVLLGHE